ncbi:MAG: glycosyltransferase [Anaerolineae bacterium]|nr:glycosyltransferase [Anaerolineae bacterium]
MEFVLETLLVLAAGLYLVAVVLLTVFVGSFGVLIALYLRARWQDSRRSRAGVGAYCTPIRGRCSAAPLQGARDEGWPPDAFPPVTIQLPIYNEAHVVERLIAACARLDYPRDRLHIQVIDDSTDETTRLLRQAISVWEGQGAPPIILLRRPSRSGYKAGALAYGLERVTTPFVAIFDADFVPPPDLLRRAMPPFAADARLALVQTRWSHLNAGDNLLTRAQALNTDGHFIIEQIARSRGGLPMSMNGSGGVWRVAALRDAGGWSAATLTEDLDLSYRALLRGWRFAYLPGVAAPGELPPQVQAYKLQQRRWATGMTQNLLRHAIPLLRAERYAPWQRVMGLMHLGQYAVQPLILLAFLLTPPLIAGGMFARLPNLGPFGAVGLIPPLMMILAQHALYPDWPRRLLFMPVQGAIGVAVVLNNTAGVLAALTGPPASREFKRTPKFSATGADWARSRYALPADRITLGELALAAYALVGLGIALARLPALAPYFATYAFSFAAFALWNLAQARRARRAPDRAREKTVRKPLEAGTFTGQLHQNLPGALWRGAARRRQTSEVCETSEVSGETPV